MFGSLKSSHWASILLGGLAVAFMFRYIAVLQSGVSHSVAIRTYVFWALVIAPVAYLTDMVGRSVAEYHVVQVAVARVKDRRRR